MTAYHSSTVLQHATGRVRQGRVASRVGLTLLWAMVAGLVSMATWDVPARHLPWGRLELNDPVGLFTRGKIARADPALCRATLVRGGISYADQPARSGASFCGQTDVVRLTGGAAPLSPADVSMTCNEALAFSLWERQVVQTAAYQHLGSGVVGVINYGAYACRRQYGAEEGPVSEHAKANALDVAGFVLADGRRIMVARDWTRKGPESAFLHAVRDGGCDVFSVTLSPDFNAEHADHLHLDMGRGKVCK